MVDNDTVKGSADKLLYSENVGAVGHAGFPCQVTVVPVVL
jgi:hypothetical protein